MPKVCIHKSYEFSHFTMSKWCIDCVEVDVTDSEYDEYVQVKGAYDIIQDLLKKRYRAAVLAAKADRACPRGGKCPTDEVD